jgi:hypothetical protein
MRESSKLSLSTLCRLGGLIVSLSFSTWKWTLRSAEDLLPKKRQRPRMIAKINRLMNTVTAFRATHLAAFFAGAPGSLC